MSYYENAVKAELRKVVLDLHNNRISRQDIEKFIDKEIVAEVFRDIEMQESVARQKKKLANRLSFELKPEHIKLLQRLSIEWEDDGAYLGCITGDSKRPYGNSDIEDDIRQITGKDLTDSQCRDLHEEVKFALQIICRNGKVKTGTYTRPDEYGDRWSPKQSSNNEVKHD